MRLSSAFAAVALLAAPTLVLGSGGGGRVKSGPPEIPYLCHDDRGYSGHEAIVVYEGGSDYIHAKARLTYNGQTTEFRAAPTLYGVRYRTEAEPAVAWTLRGEEAFLTESPDAESYIGPERRIASCIRLRDEPTDAPPEGAEGGEHASHGAHH